MADADPLQAEIDALERVVYAPQRYAPTVLSPASPEDAAAQQQHITAAGEKLNRLRAEQIQRAAAKFGRAPISGQRLTTGDLPRPEPVEPASWKDDGHNYDPFRRAAEEFGWSTE